MINRLRVKIYFNTFDLAIVTIEINTFWRGQKIIFLEC